MFISFYLGLGLSGPDDKKRRRAGQELGNVMGSSSMDLVVSQNAISMDTKNGLSAEPIVGSCWDQ